MQANMFRCYTRFPLTTTIKNTYRDLEKMGIRLTGETIEHILKAAAVVPHGDKKNVVAYLLGFYVVVDGAVDRDRLQTVLQNVHKLETPLKPEDVIRYARLWLS